MSTPGGGQGRADLPGPGVLSERLPQSGARREAPLSVAIVSNGFSDGPAQALRDYLVGKGARVHTVFHPLTREQGRRHFVTTHADGQVASSRSVWLPLRPPLSYALDPFVPLRAPRVDVWIGFNPLACARGLVARSLGQAGMVVLWSVDFVPNRFGRASPLTRLYDWLDRLSSTRADARIELSEAARLARDSHHGLAGKGPRAHVVPMGAWLDRTPTVAEDGYRQRRVVFLGHLVPRQGVSLLVDALAIVRSHGEEVVADLIGAGPDEPVLREQVRRLGLESTVRIHGFVPDHRDVERLLATASIAVAPYVPSAETFTRHADPGKLKAYLAAGLPIILTDVPPNAPELAREAGAVLIPYDAAALASAIVDGLASREQWRQRRGAARAYARRFDWGILLPDAMRKLGIETG